MLFLLFKKALPQRLILAVTIIAWVLGFAGCWTVPNPVNPLDPLNGNGGNGNGGNGKVVPGTDVEVSEELTAMDVVREVEGWPLVTPDGVMLVPIGVDDGRVVVKADTGPLSTETPKGWMNWIPSGLPGLIIIKDHRFIGKVEVFATTMVVVFQKTSGKLLVFRFTPEGTEVSMDHLTEEKPLHIIEEDETVAVGGVEVLAIQIVPLEKYISSETNG